MKQADARTTDEYLKSLADSQVKLIVEALTDDDRPAAKQALWLAQLELKRRDKRVRDD